MLRVQSARTLTPCKPKSKMGFTIATPLTESLRLKVHRIHVPLNLQLLLCVLDLYNLSNDSKPAEIGKFSLSVENISLSARAIPHNWSRLKISHQL